MCLSWFSIECAILPCIYFVPCVSRSMSHHCPISYTMGLTFGNTLLSGTLPIKCVWIGMSTIVYMGTPDIHLWDSSFPSLSLFIRKSQIFPWWPAIFFLFTLPSQKKSAIVIWIFLSTVGGGTQFIDEWEGLGVHVWLGLPYHHNWVVLFANCNPANHFANNVRKVNNPRSTHKERGIQDKLWDPVCAWNLWFAWFWFF